MIIAPFGRLFLCFSLFCLTAFSEEPRRKYYESISVDSIKENVLILASEEMQGRETGENGQKLAAKFLATKYLSWNLNAGGVENGSMGIRPEDFMQPHPISTRNNKKKNLTINGENFLFGKDFYYSCLLNDTGFTANDFCFIGASEKTMPDKIFTEKHSANQNVVFLSGDEDRNKATINHLASLSNKPYSVLIVANSEELTKLFYKNDTDKTRTPFPCIYVSDNVAEKIFGKNKFQKLKNKSESKQMPLVYIQESACNAELLRNTEKLKGQNVVAYIKGTDTLGETVVVSSHYDHLGKRDTSIYYGADDNASGTAAILEMARIFTMAKNNGHPPKRNILFLNVSGEEKGLLGSAWYVEHPFIPMDKTVANLNIDMIGRIDPYHDSTGVLNYVYIIGSDKMSTDLHNINLASNETGPQLELNYKYNTKDDPNQFYRRSDHFNFVKKKVPVIFYFNGTHKDYHKPTDTSEKINFNILTKRAGLVFLTAWEIANRTERVVVDKANNEENK
jgi:hypothetical protein